MRRPQPESMTPAMLVRQALDLHESSLIHYARSILGGDEDRARDVVQDTLLKLYLADANRVGENLKAWLYTVCRNRAFDVLRRENRMVLSEDGGPMEWLEEWQTSSRNTAADEETLGQVWKFIEQLPGNQREVIRLKFQHDLSYKDISGITGLSVTNVGFLLHTGLKRLRKLLQHTRSEHLSS